MKLVWNSWPTATSLQLYHLVHNHVTVSSVKQYFTIIIIIMNEKHSITDVYTGTKNSSTQQELSAVTN